MLSSNKWSLSAQRASTTLSLCCMASEDSQSDAWIGLGGWDLWLALMLWDDSEELMQAVLDCRLLMYL